MTNNKTADASLGRGYTIGLASAAVVSLTGVFIRYLTDTFGIPPLVLSLWRELFVAIILGVVLALARPPLLKLRKGEVAYLAAYGLALAGFNALWTTAVALNGAAVATVMAYTSAAFTAALGWWLLHESMTVAKLAAVALTLSGCVVVSGALSADVWRLNLVGVVTGLLSGLAYSIYSLMGRRAAQVKINPWTSLLYTFGFGSMWMLAANLLGAEVIPGAARGGPDLLWLGASIRGWGALVALAAGPTLLGFGLYNVALGYLPSSTANLIMTIEPLFTGVVAWFALGERFTLQQLLGSALIGTGVLWLRLFERKPPSS